MEASAITNILLPLALGVIMLGLGLSLTLEDFRRVAVYPRAVVAGLLLQMFVLTAVALGAAKLFGLAPELAVGLMLLAASPGGATANIFSHLARGDVALNITLTAINSALALLWLPLVVNWSLDHFLGQGQYIAPPTGKIVEVAAIIVLPVALGMIVRARAPGFAMKMERPIRIFAVIFLALLVAGAIAQEWKTLGPALAAVGLACLVFNLVSLAVGYAAPLALKLPRRQAIAIAMEIGIHNGTLAIYIALNVLQKPSMSLAPAIYSLIMFITAALFVLLLARRHAPAAAGAKA
jgi:BASS family bile acid:Na+ symporter